MAGARSIASVWLLTAALACGRSELGGDETSENGGAAGRAGGSSTSGHGGSGVSGNSGVAGGANSNGVGGGAGFGVSGQTGNSGATGQAGNSGTSGQFGNSGATGQAGNSGASGSGGSVENCSNGIDDDRDGNIDCADADCVVGYSCAPPIPGGGWVGPLSFWSGSGQPPACTNANGFPTEVTNAGTGISQTAASTCYSCSCGAPHGISCQVGTAAFFSDGTCSGQGGNLTVVQGMCIAFVSLTLDPSGVRWQSAPAAGGACIPKSSGSAVFPPVQWDTRMRACGDPPPDGGGCGAGTCVARPKDPFSKQLCIYQRGDLACPSGLYNNQYVYFTGVDDTRTCSDCACTPPTATSCTGSMKLYTDQDCLVDETTLSSVLECSALAPDPTPPPPPYVTLRSIKYTGSANDAGYCAVQPSTAGGSVIPSDPITLCCTSP
ncbi:MAG: hypothetical protein WDO74_27895 [Pseudomonadota bacterium]